MSKRDYYKVLGVSRSTDKDEIKSAYRKLAKKWHPDVNKSADAETRFSEIQEAYDVLSDDEKRTAYDRFGHVGVGGGAAGSGGRAGTWDVHVGPDGFRGGVDMGSVFEEIFGRSRSGRGGAGAGGGGGRGPSQAPPPQRGRDLHHTITVTFKTAMMGGKESLRVHHGEHEETIDVSIPKGVHDGAKLRLRGKGEPSPGPGGPAGDLIISIKVGGHPYYRREGLDIYLDVPITVAEAIAGTSVTVPTIKGSVALKIPPGTESGQKLRVPGHGIENAKGSSGDFYAVVQVKIPTGLSNDDEETIRDLGSRLPNPRTGSPWDD